MKHNSRRFLIVMMFIWVAIFWGCQKASEEIVDDNSETINHNSEVIIENSDNQTADGDELQSDENVEEGGLDCAVFWKQITENVESEQKDVLMIFEPIFCDDKELLLFWSGEDVTQEVTLSSIANYAREEDNFQFDVLEKFVLLDMTGDGTDELILCFDMGLDRSYLVLLEENGKYYCSYHSNNRMRYLDKTGLYNAGDGVTVASFTRLSFDGSFAEKEMACWQIEQDYVNWEVHFIGTIDGEAVTEEAFQQWEDENVKEEPDWVWIETENNPEVLIEEREALDMAYTFYYGDSELKEYGVFCEEVPHSNTPQMGYVVVQYTDSEYEKYSQGNIASDKDKIILAYDGFSADNQYYTFWLYQYIAEENGEYQISTLDYIAVSVDGEEIITERRDENGEYITNPNEWNIF